MNREDYDLCIHHLGRIRRLVNNAVITTPGVYADLVNLLADIERKLKESKGNL